jgi:hypothetical protein
MKWSLVLLFVAATLAPLGIVAIIENQPYAETFSFAIPPSGYIYISIQITDGGRVSGNFSEGQSQLISVYVFNQQQLDQYQNNRPLASLFSTTDASSGTYAASILTPGTYYLVTAHGIGYEQTPEQLTLTLRVDGTNLPYLGLESLAPIAVGLLAAAYFLRKQQNRRLISLLLKATPNFGPGQGEEDNRILSIAKDLCRQLHAGFDPLTIYWIAWVPLAGIRAPPSDQCLLGVKGTRRGYVYLPAALRGKLEPSEWEPLIASSLIWSFRPELRRRRVLINRLWLLMMVLVAIAPLAILWFLRSLILVENPAGRFAIDQLSVLVFFVVVFLTIFSARQGNMNLRKYFLEADRLAAEVVGKDVTVRALQKIDSMGLADIEEGKKEKPTIWRRAGVLPWPSITLRIHKLETP